VSPHKLILVVALAFTLGGACSKPSTDTVVACQERVTSFSAWARAVQARPSTGARVVSPNVLALPAPPSVSPFEDAIVVAVTAEGITVEGDPVASEALVANLSKHGARIDKIAAGAGDPIGPRWATLAVAADAPWSAVVVAADALLAAGFPRLQLAFAYPEPIASPGPSAVDDEVLAILDAPPPDELGGDGGRARKLARLSRITERLVRGCAPPRSPVAALDDCRCRMDFASLRTVTWIVSTPDSVWVTHRTLATDGAELALPGATPWSEAHRALLATSADAPLHLVAR